MRVRTPCGSLVVRELDAVVRINLVDVAMIIRALPEFGMRGGEGHGDLVGL